MKIEICEQMVQSWLQNYKQCEVVQTNWKVSPLRLRSITDADIAELEKFMKEFNDQLDETLRPETKASLQDTTENTVSNDEVQRARIDLNIFKKSTARQFIRQCEIDVVGCKLDEGITERIYLVDTAFHKTGLGYHDPVATVVKKIVRALVVAVLIFGESVPVTVAFVSPKCGATLQPEIETVVNGLRKILVAHSRYANIEIELYFNERFTSDIYIPLMDEMDELNDDNDLFMRAMNLASLAEEHRTTSTTSVAVPSTTPTSSTSATRTRRGENKEIVLGTLTSVVKSGKMTPTLLDALKTSSYTKSSFKLPTYPLLILVSDFASTGYERCRYYPESIEINGDNYYVCSQWVPERIEKLKSWYSSL
jgi:hypothetical protein